MMLLIDICKRAFTLRSINFRPHWTLLPVLPCPTPCMSGSYLPVQAIPGLHYLMLPSPISSSHAARDEKKDLQDFFLPFTFSISLLFSHLHCDIVFFLPLFYLSFFSLLSLSLVFLSASSFLTNLCSRVQL
ncbi:hypothetical protein BJX65DRAFT_20477 [Aspergillus insuetus]